MPLGIVFLYLGWCVLILLADIAETRVAVRDLSIFKTGLKNSSVCARFLSVVYLKLFWIFTFLCG